MSDALRSLQRSFFEHVRGSGVPWPAGGSPRGWPRVYAHAYRARLADALRAHFGTTAEVLEDRFDALADAYIRAHPSLSPSLRDFGQQFPSFAARRFGPAVGELAAFEQVLRDSFDAADAPRMTLAELQQLDAPAFVELRLRLHPSVSLFETRWGSIDAWHAVARGEVTKPAAEGPPVLWLVYRSPDRLTRFRSLDPVEARVVEGFARGRSFAEVCDDAIEVAEPSAVPAIASAALRQLLTDGAVVRGGMAQARKNSK